MKEDGKYFDNLKNHKMNTTKPTKNSDDEGLFESLESWMQTAFSEDVSTETTEPPAPIEDAHLNQNLTEVEQIINNLLDFGSDPKDVDTKTSTWKETDISVSPETKEKVYVVTPVSWTNKGYILPKLKPSGFVLPKHTTEKNLDKKEDSSKVSLPASG